MKKVFAYMFESVRQEINIHDYNKVDVINYSFGLIKEGKLSIAHLNSLKTVLDLRKKYQHLKVVLSIGGWGADGFSDAVYSKNSRNVFIDSILKVVNEYDLDGIDLDWEYPTFDVAKIKARVEDKQNFTLFIQELRAKMPSKLLTIAVGAGNGIAKAIEVDVLNGYLDYLHIMTYDMGNFKNNQFSHHTNLYPSKYHSYSASQAVEVYNKLGFDIKKIVMGIAFYGRYGLLNNKFEVARGFGYQRILELKSTMNYYFDEEAKAPIIYNDDYFVSFDDEASVTEKCKYVINNKMAGVMFWEINSDKTGILLNTIDKVLKKG